jgi:hypothetical protein
METERFPEMLVTVYQITRYQITQFWERHISNIMLGLVCVELWEFSNVSADFAIAIFRVNDFERGFRSSYIVLVLESLFEEKPWLDEECSAPYWLAIRSSRRIMQCSIIKRSEEKTQGIYFSRSRRPPESCLALNGRNIPFVGSVKYLGVSVDRRIRWRLHIEMIEAKAFRTFISAYSLFRSERLSANIKLTLHKAHIRSVMT